MFRACHLPIPAPCRNSTMASSQYHLRCRSGLNGLPSGRLDGQLWRAEEGVPAGWGGKTGWCQTLPEPQPRAPRPSHGPCECSWPASGPPAGGMGRRGGPKWASRMAGAAKQGGAKRCRSPNQGPPDRPMGRVSAAGPPLDLRPAVWADAEGRSGRPGGLGRRNLVVPKAAGAPRPPTKAPPTVPWTV